MNNWQHWRYESKVWRFFYLNAFMIEFRFEYADHIDVKMLEASSNNSTD